MRFITLLAFFLSISIAAICQNDTIIDYLVVGDQIPTFTFQTIDKQTISSIDFQDKTTMLVFFATWCPPCMEELPHIQREVWEKFRGDEHFQLFVIARGHTDQEIIAFKQKKGFTFPMVADTNRSLFDLFAKQNIPRTYLIDEHSKIIKRSTGFNKEEFKLIIENIKKELID